MDSDTIARAGVVLAASLAAPALAQGGEVIIPAERLAAPELRADEPTPGKWWLKRDAQDWGVADGKVLMTGVPSQEPLKTGFWDVIPLFRFVPYRVPELVIDPQVAGWHRLYIGLYHDDIDYWSRPMVAGGLSDEPFTEFLQPPRDATGRIAEVYWRAADLTGKKLRLQQPPGPMPHTGAGWMGGITHLRLVPMTTEEVAAAQREIDLPPVEQRLFAMLDTTDEIYWYGTAEREEDIHAIVWQHQQAGFGRVYWRCFGTHLDNSLDVPDAAPRWSAADEAAYRQQQNTAAGWAPYIELSRRFDPLKVAVEYGRSIGCDVHAMVRLTNFNRAPYANFWHENPQFQAQRFAREKNEKGRNVTIEPKQFAPYPRVLSFAYPEVRDFYVRFCRQIASTGTRGIMLDMLRHPPIAGYETIVTDAFREKHGREMWEDLRDLWPAEVNRETLKKPAAQDQWEWNLFNDPLVQAHLSEYLRLFLVDLRQAVGPEFEIAVRCRGPEAFGFRGKEFIEQGLVDSIVDGQWYSGNGPRPTIDATVAAAGSRGKALAAASYSDVDPTKNWRPRKGPISGEAILALAQAYSGRGVAMFGLYESTLATRCPDTRRAVREAGWNYEPGRK